MSPTLGHVHRACFQGEAEQSGEHKLVEEFQENAA